LVQSFSGVCVAQSSVFCVFVIFLSAIKYLSFCFVIRTPVYLFHVLLMKYHIDPLRLITNKDSSQFVVQTIEDAQIGSWRM